MASLRRRLLLGAVLWTTGLFMLAGVLVTAMMLHHYSGPGLVHGFFAHYLPVTILGLLCLAIGVMAVRRGVAPLNQLRARLGAVHGGDEARVTGTYPTEIQPLVDDLNALLEHREQMVRRALAKAGDLAHGLKTPLAVLTHESEQMRRSGDGSAADAIDAQVERMRRQVDYHLAHARAAASGTSSGARCAVSVSAEALARTLLRLHDGRALGVDLSIPPTHVVRCQREDLDEMLGNLLDNACKWARARVRIASALDDGMVVVDVEDDGPGIAASMREAVLQRGVRADEAAPGFGLGLAIVRDLAELYGGSIALEAVPGGGARAQLRLPAA